MLKHLRSNLRTIICYLCLRLNCCCINGASRSFSSKTAQTYFAFLLIRLNLRTAGISGLVDCSTCHFQLVKSAPSWFLRHPPTIGERMRKRGRDVSRCRRRGSRAQGWREMADLLQGLRRGKAERRKGPCRKRRESESLIKNGLISMAHTHIRERRWRWGVMKTGTLTQLQHL